VNFNIIYKSHKCYNITFTHEICRLINMDRKTFIFSGLHSQPLQHHMTCCQCDCLSYCLKVEYFIFLILHLVPTSYPLKLPETKTKTKKERERELHNSSNLRNPHYAKFTTSMCSIPPQQCCQLPNAGPLFMPVSICFTIQYKLHK
jgi:hypothetical protein